MKINNTKELRAHIREGKYTFPGCYPLYFIADDGAALCFECARKEYRQISYSIRHNINDGWKIIGIDVNFEDNDLFCAHCNKKIESAYGDN